MTPVKTPSSSIRAEKRRAWWRRSRPSSSSSKPSSTPTATSINVVGVGALQARYDVPFLLHPADRPLLAEARLHAAYFGLEFSGEVRRIQDLHDEMILPLGGGNLRVLHTPGHTPGGVCLLYGDQLLSGDTLFARSVGRTDLEGGDTATLLRSIREKLLTLPDATNVYPGHGPATRIGVERRQNPYLR